MIGAVIGQVGDLLMPHWFWQLLLVFVLGGLIPGCREDAAPAPPESVKSAPEPQGDITKFARFKADVSFQIPYLAILFERDPVDAGTMHVTLASSQNGPKGERLFFQSHEKVRSLTDMKTQSIDFGCSNVTTSA